MTDSLLQIPFRGGPNESKDDRALEPGEVVSLLNVSYDADGEYQPRLGYTALASFTTPSHVSRLFVDGSELMLSDGHTLSSYNPSAAAFVSKDLIPEYAVTHASLINSSGTFSSFGEAYASGYRIVAWIDPSDGFVRAVVLDATTGAIVQPPTLVATGTWTYLAVGVVGTTAIIVASSSSPSIAGWSLALSPLGTWSGATALSDATYLVTNGIFGVAWLASSFILGYQRNASGANQSLTLLSYTSAFGGLHTSTQTSTLTGPFSTVAGAGVFGGSAFFGATSTGGTAGNILWQVDATALTAISSGTMTVPTNVGQTTATMNGNARSSSIAMPTSTTCVWAIEFGAVSAGQPQIGIAWASFNASTTLVGVPMGAVGVGLASGLAYVSPTLSYSTTIVFTRALSAGPGTGQPSFGTFLLLDLQTGTTNALVSPRVLAVLAPLTGQNSTFPTSPTPPTINVGPGGALECAMPIMRTTLGRQGLDLFVLSPAVPGAAFLGKELYVGGAYYDGVTLVETAFATPPQVQITANASGNATFEYCTTWARVDAQGNLEESAPSQVTTLTSSATPNVAVSAIALHATNKQRTNTTSFGVTAGSGSNVYMVVYRTPNLANGDTTFYRVTNDPFPTNCKNTQLNSSVTYTDTLSDSSLTDGTHPVLYTTSGELAHNAPESFFGFPVSHNDRIWGIGADRRTVWYSQTYADGVLPSWNILQSFTVDDANEPLVALGVLYDKLLVFTKTHVYALYGDGPSISGANSDLSPPQVIPTAVGCIEPRSIVTCALGVMYQSQRGIDLIDNGLNPTFVGLPVSVTTATYPICTSAVQCGNTSTVRFTFVTSEAYPLASNAVGRTVVYDLRRNLWTVHSLSGGADAPVESAVYHPIYGYVVGQNTPGSAASTVLRENTTADAAPWLDGSTPQTMTVVTSWVKSGDLQGWQKVRRAFLLAKYYDSHAVNVSFTYNYQNANAELHAFNASTIANVAVSGLEQVRMIPARGRSQSFQATISVSAQANTSGRACGLTAMAYEIHPQKGGMRDIPPAAES